jgi:hypothetical protein
VKKTAKGKILVIMLTLVLCWLGTAGAESNTATGNGALSASARLNFQITIPKFIIFRVGTAGAGNIDTVLFDPAATNVANATAGFGATGGTGTVAVSIISNGGAVTLLEANDGGGNGLSDGGATPNYISYAQINTADGGNITPPTLSDAGGNVQTITPTAGAVTIRNDTWTYTYDNPATPPAPGTYTGQVTYTASVP